MNLGDLQRLGAVLAPLRLRLPPPRIMRDVVCIVYNLAGEVIHTGTSPSVEQALQKAQAACSGVALVPYARPFELSAHQWLLELQASNPSGVIDLLAIRMKKRMTSTYECLVKRGLQWPTYVVRIGDAILAWQGTGYTTWGCERCGGKAVNIVRWLTLGSKVFANRGAWVALQIDGTVLCWGLPEAGGNIPPSIKQQLWGIKDIQQTEFAFAALRIDGVVLTWGRHDRGGRMGKKLQEQLRHVLFISASDKYFAAATRDAVVMWKDENHVQWFQGVRASKLVPTTSAFAAMCNNDDGSEKVVILGDAGCHWGDRAGQHEVLNAVDVLTTHDAFAIITAEGIETLGRKAMGGECPNEVKQRLTSMSRPCRILSNPFAFTIAGRNHQTGNLSLETWGHQDYGGDSRQVRNVLSNVQSIDLCENTCGAFAVIVVVNGARQLVTWGHQDFGGNWRTALDAVSKADQVDEGQLSRMLAEAAALHANSESFCVVLGDGTVWCWGSSLCTKGFANAKQRIDEEGAVEVLSSAKAFTVVTSKGSRISWGDEQSGAQY